MKLVLEIDLEQYPDVESMRHVFMDLAKVTKNWPGNASPTTLLDEHPELEEILLAEAKKAVTASEYDAMGEDAATQLPSTARMYMDRTPFDSSARGDYTKGKVQTVTISPPEISEINDLLKNLNLGEPVVLNMDEDLGEQLRAVFDAQSPKTRH